jgi:uncharacterized protein (TIGR00251 family)
LVLVQNVSKLYRLYGSPADRLRELLPGAQSLHTDFWALRDITLSVEKGETLGLVGPNGCGKSTLLQIVCGILPPTGGRVVARGRIAALLELGAGFNPEFTGRENVYLNGEIMGMSRAEIEKAMPSIEAFAEIGEFMARPVKEYSSGMYVRLAFSTAIHVDPEILIVDEALAVGDAVFANRCVRKFQELRERKITVLFVSHDLGLVKQLSDRAILLIDGRIAAQGSPNDVINRYIGLVLAKEEAKDRKENRIRASFRHGDGTSEILGIDILNARGEPVTSVAGGEPITVRVRSRFHRPKSNPMVGILIRTRSELPPGMLADAAAVHPYRGDAGFGRVQPRLAGRRHRVRGGGYARRRRRGQPARGGRMARIAVKVHPRARRSAITGRLGDAWKLDLAAPPVDGKANEECIRFFAELAGVPRSRVRIVTGATGRMKVVEIDGVALEDLVGRAGVPTP